MTRDSNRRNVVKQPNLFSRNAAKENRLSFKATDENIDLAEESPFTVGAQLRAAREAKGLSLHQVADILRLKASQVHALEEGNFSSLPGQTFVTGFLRSYANLLDLDAVAIVELYKHEEGGGLHVPSLAFPEPTSGGRIPGAGILLGTFVVALVLLAGWFLYQESESIDFERVAELPEHLASKIRDLEDFGSENTPDARGLDNGVQGPQNITEIPLQTSIEPPEIKVGENTDPETLKEDVAASNPDDVTTQVEVASDTLEGSNPQVTEPIASRESEGTAVASSDSSEALTASETAEATINEGASIAADTSQAASPDETQIATVAETTEEEAAVPPVSEPPAEPVGAYPQDTLASASVDQLESTEAPESPLPRTFGVENADVRVVLRATAESWVEVKAADQKPVLSRVLKPGDVYMAPNSPDLLLTTGNAGGLEIRVDGKEIRSLGGTGTILRGVPLLAESLLENNGLQ